MRISRKANLGAFLLMVVFGARLLTGCGDFWKPPTGSTTTGTSSAITLVASANSVAVGSSVTLTATVTPTAASGTVTFLNGSSSLGTAALASGTATLMTSFSTAGTQSLTASYSGDSTYGASTSSAVVVTVTGSTTAAIMLVPSTSSLNLGARLTLTATLNPTEATGTVTFFNGTKVLGSSMLSAGTASQSSPIFVSGDQTLTAIYSGNATYTATTSNGVAVNVGPPGTASTSLSFVRSPSSNFAASSAVLVANVSPSDATGEISFYDGTVLLGIELLNSGSAILTQPKLSSGMHTLKAVYSGDSTYSSSTSDSQPLPVE